MSIDADIDLSSFVLAVEGQDREQQLDLYDDHAEMCIFDPDTSLAPRLLTRKARDRRLGRRHDSRLTYTDHCRKPHGLNTVYQATAELHQGRITSQTVAVVWEDCRY